MAMSFGAAAFSLTVPSIVKLLKYEWLLDKKVRDGLVSLQAELNSMHAFLGDVSSLAPDLQLGPHAKLQADEVSDLSHSIGTCLHSFLVRIESSNDTSKLIINHEVDIYIDDTRIKVKELRERHGPYPPRSSLVSTCTQKLDPRILAQYKRESNPIGIEGAIADLTNMLSEDNHAMISIVGMGGIGKTTLAQAVYDKMKRDFDWCAFLPIGQRAGPEKVLKDIFDGLRIEMYGKEPKQLQLANQLQELLAHKRCLIVFDDIWDKETWSLIENVCGDSAGSKIITTTRNRQFAEEFGGIYEIKPLCTDDSRKLLRTKAKVKSHDTDFEILSDKILHKCVGVPMAITVIGSFLAKKPRSQWNREYDSIGFDVHKKDSAFEIITKVMRYSYIDLPYPIRNCFLYLSLFPKDHWIEKNMLIWRWVAEGLVPDKSFETGGSYLNELIDRSMLQWAVSPRDVGQGGCRVHSLMVDLIRDLSSSQEQNFCTVLDMRQESTSRTRPIHRLAIHETILGQNQNTSLNVGEVKSFYASSCTGSSFPPLKNFVELCVIDLEACDLSEGECKLEDLGSKCLEYVGLLGTPVAELPDKIAGLKLLQTLDVTATGISKMPPFVEELVKLRCLRAGKGTSMMGRVEKLTSLEELWLYSADKSPNFAVGLRNLSKMRVLVIHFDKIDNGMQEALVESLHELKKLQVLQVWSDAEGKVHLDCWEGSVPSSELRQLLLFGVILTRFTPWIHQSCVPKLSKLLLEVVILTVQDLKILGEMPSLGSLYLHSKDNLSYTAGREEFKVLEYLNTNIELVCGDGALPAIKELEVGGIMVGTDVGLKGNMPLLERASYHLDCTGCLLVEIEKAEALLMQASQAHHNHPTLSIKRFNNYEIELEEQHRFIESAAPDFLRALVLALSDPGGISGLGGGDEGQVSVFLNMANSIARFRSAVGEPPILTMGDATDSTGSPSQSAGGVPPRRPNGEGQVLLATSSRFQSAKRKAQFSTNELLANLKGQSAANLASSLATLVGTEQAVVMGMLEKWSRSPEMIASLNSIEWDANGSLSPSNISTLLQLMTPDISQLGGLGRGSGTSSHDSTTPTEELSDNSVEFDADSVLDRADSLIADDAMSAPAGSLLADNAGPGTTATDVSADARKSLTKSMQNTEVVASLKSLPNAGGSEPSASDVSKLGKLMMADLTSTMDKQTQGPGRGQGAEAAFSSKVVDQFSRNPQMIASTNSMVQNGDFPGMVPGLISNLALGSLLENLAVASSYATVAQGVAAAPKNRQDGVDANLAEKHRAERSGASVSCEPMPKVPSMHTQVHSVFSKLNSPDGADFASKVVGQFSGNPEMIASINSVLQNRNILGMIPGLLSNPAFSSILENLVAKPSFMDVIASSSPTVAPGLAAAKESNQDGENFSRMFNLKELLPSLKQALDAGESSGQPSSAQADNTGTEKDRTEEGGTEEGGRDK